MKLLDHTQRRSTVGRTPLDEWSARRRDLYVTTHNTHNRHTSIRTHNLSRQAAADLRLRPRGYWDRPVASRCTHKHTRLNQRTTSLSSFTQQGLVWRFIIVNTEQTGFSENASAFTFLTRISSNIPNIQRFIVVFVSPSRKMSDYLKLRHDRSHILPSTLFHSTTDVSVTVSVEKWATNAQQTQEPSRRPTAARHHNRTVVQYSTCCSFRNSSCHDSFQYRSLAHVWFTPPF